MVEERNAEAGTLMLTDLRTLFVDKGVDRMPSTEIVDALNEMDGRPWPEWKAGRPMTATQLAHVLKPFGVRPTTYRPPGGEKVVKGYIKDSFSDAWKRYLVVDTLAAPAQGPAERLHGNIIVNDREFRENRSVTLDRVLPLHNSENHSPSLQCYRVTDQHPRDRLDTAMMPDPDVEIGEAEGEL